MKKFLYLVLPLMLTLSGCGDVEWFPRDTQPDSFSFSQRSNVEVNKVVTSDPITVTGNQMPATITVTNGEYAIDGSETFTSQPGTISSGQTVTVRHVASGSIDTSVSTVIDIGGVTAVFTSTASFVTSDPTGTFLLSTVNIEPGESDATISNVDMELELKNTSTTSRYSLMLVIVARDAAGNVVHSESVQIDEPLDPGETAFLYPVFSLPKAVFATVARWNVISMDRLDP